MRYGRLYAAGLVRHAGKRQSHLHSSERADQADVVEVSQMADPEGRAGEAPEADAERHVVAIQHQVDQPPGVVALRQQRGGDRRAVLGGIGADQLESHACTAARAAAAWRA